MTMQKLRFSRQGTKNINHKAKLTTQITLELRIPVYQKTIGVMERQDTEQKVFVTHSPDKGLCIWIYRELLDDEEEEDRKWGRGGEILSFLHHERCAVENKHISMCSASSVVTWCVEATKRHHVLSGVAKMTSVGSSCCCGWKHSGEGMRGSAPWKTGIA